MQAELFECITCPTPAQRQIDAVGPEILVTSVIVLYVREVEHGIEVGELVDGIALFVSEIVVRAYEFVVHKVLVYLPEVTVVVYPYFLREFFSGHSHTFAGKRFNYGKDNQFSFDSSLSRYFIGHNDEITPSNLSLSLILVVYNDKEQISSVRAS